MDADEMMDAESADQVHPLPDGAAQVAEADDGTGDFIDMNDVVEVPVDDTEPMEDDDSVAIVQGSAADGTGTQAAPIEDMSKAKLEGHTDHVYAVATHYDASTNTLTAVSGGGDDKSFLYKIQPGSPPGTRPLDHSHTDSVACTALNLDCNLTEDATKTPPLAAVGGYDGAIVIYNPYTGEKLQVLEGPSDVEWLCFHPKGGSVLLAGSVADGTVWMYHIPMKKCMQVFVGHQSGVTAGSFSADGKWALSASQDGTLRVWAPRTGNCRHTFKTGEAGLTCLAIGGGSDGQLVLVGAEDGAAHACHVGTKKIVATLRHFEPPNNQANDDEEMELPMSVEAVGFSPANPNWCATGGVDGVLKIWDLSHDGQCRQVCKRPEEGNTTARKAGITRLRWHAALPLVLTASTDGVLRLWDARSGGMLKEITGHSDVINDMDVAFLQPENNGGTLIAATASDDKSARIFEIDVAAALTSQQQ